MALSLISPVLYSTFTDLMPAEALRPRCSEVGFEGVFRNEARTFNAIQGNQAESSSVYAYTRPFAPGRR